VAPCNELAKYFYTRIHLQYTWYKAMVEVFFQLTSRWSKWCAQPLHQFSQIFKFYSAILAPIVAPPSNNFQNCSIAWKGFSSAKKRCKPRLNRPTNPDAMSCGSNSTTHQSGRRPTALFSKEIKQNQREKHHISCSHADVRRVISTKFCVVIEVVRAIILGPKRFWVPSIVLPLWGVENLAENAPVEVNC